MIQLWVLKLASVLDNISATIFATDTGNGWPLLPDKRKKPVSPTQPIPGIPEGQSIPDDLDEQPSIPSQPTPKLPEEPSTNLGDIPMSLQVIFQS